MTRPPQCEWCSGGYWDCGPRPRCTFQDAHHKPHSDWQHVADVLLEAGRTYYVKCRPGCGARVDDDDSVDPPWILVGSITPTNEGAGKAGTYELWCKTGGGQACNAVLYPKPASPG